MIATILKRLALALLVLLLLLMLAAWWLLRGSVPTLDGAASLPGLTAPVAIQRDSLGVVTVDAENEEDAMRALGYVHGQERFFEMDLMRRTAAGELAELFGPLAVDTDKRHRVHRLRARAVQQLGAIAGDKASVMQAYVDGVNAGLADLKVRPWPYLLLRTQPRPWQPADTPLVGYAMYFDLQGGGNERELALWKIRQVVPPALFALLARDGSRWDAPLVGRPRGDAALPDAATVDLRALPMPKQPRELANLLPPLREIGSNNFAVSGALTRDGRAIVADDMHLGLRAPNIWFRARLRYPDLRAADGRVDVAGFTLPGLPLVVAGSNGHVGWGFTNSYIDALDWKQILPCAPGAGQASCTLVTAHHESILVAGGAPVSFRVNETDWGPIIASTPHGDAFALRWTAQLPGSLNLALIDMGKAASLDQALAVADRVAIPAQNLMIADSAGRIAWRLTGTRPQRAGGCSAQHLVERADGGTGATLDANTSHSSRSCSPWQIVTADAPAIANPERHRLWTANNRLLDGAALEDVGDAGYALGARAQQVRGDLFAKQRFNERDLLAIQLDDRAVFLQRWWQLLRERSNAVSSPALDALAGAAASWRGRASADSVGYRIVRAWRNAVNTRLLDGLTAPAQAALGDDFQMPDLPQFEGVAWPLVTQRPDNLLPRRFANWNALFEDAAREVRDELTRSGPLTERTWGERNTAKICHPLSMALPGFAKRMLCMPFDQLAGDTNMPRVSAPDFGASERMVVSPGHEADGIIHMPGGQSGHPLSPYWGAGHEDWVHGRATPFLPGKAQHTLRLVPPRHASGSS
jgi:penicillin G amidase